MAMSNEIISLLKNNPIFEQEPNDIFKCGLCNNVVIDCCTTSCGCLYCTVCILKYFEERNTPINCPKCKAENIGTNINANEWINTRIMILRVKCPNSSCPIIDTITNMIEHVKQCQEGKLICPFFNLGCSESEIDGINGMKNHFGLRIIDHNKLLIDEVTRLDNDNNLVKENINNLSNGQENNTNKINDIFLKLEELSNNNTDLENKIKCYERQIEELQIKVGEMERDELNLREEVEENKRQIRRDEERINEIGNKVEDCSRTNVLIGDEIKKVEEDTKTQLDKNSADLLSIKADYKKDLANVSVETNKLKEENKIMKTQILNIDKKIKQEGNDVRKEIERRWNENNKKIIKLENNLNDENEKLWKEIGLTNQFVWKLEKFDEMRKKLLGNENMKIESDIFFSHKFGYKFKLRIYGGLGRLCVRFVTMRGDFDEILDWPLRRRIKLAFINQETREDEEEHNFYIDTTRTFFKHFYNRPTESEEGGPSYCISSLHRDAKPQLFKDDVLFIRCTITP